MEVSLLWWLIWLIGGSLLLFCLWGLWVLTRQRPAYTDDLPSSASRIYTLEDIQIHYLQKGSGSDLVLLHGIGASTYIWRLLIPLLETKYKVTAIDIPGFGFSAKDPDYDHGIDNQSQTLHAFLQAIGIKHAYLVGSSMGGAIALWMAKNYPVHYPKVAALAPATNPKHTKRLRLKYLSLIGKNIRHFLKPKIFHQILRFVMRPSLINDEVVTAYLRPYQDDGSSILCFIDAFETLLKDDRLPYHLSAVKADVLLLWGEKDLLTPVQYIDELKTTLPKSVSFTHTDAGHHIMEDEPDWTAKKLADFFG